MIDASPILDQVSSHLDMTVDDGFKKRRFQVLVLSINLSTPLSVKDDHLVNTQTVNSF